jgi:hypothetical protein
MGERVGAGLTADALVVSGLFIGGGAAVASAASASVFLTSSFTAPAPTITGTRRMGTVLTAVPGVWTPVPPSLTYTPRATDVGKTLTIAVTGMKTGYTSVTKTSPAPAPTISGTPQVDKTLTAVPGAWGPAPVNLAYQWAVGGVVLAGAAGTTFQPRPVDAGKTVAVAMTGTKAGYVPATKTSSPSTPVAAGVFTAAPIPTEADTR